ncbi:MAG: RIP metalloprotease RseP [Pseudomonas sp.]|jgi:regulator of sigma E protease|nr:RIP metalloprotease RseP [Pseudomonas sp.]MDD2223157.1 RIP metalloprotease RseP [Pseudomonas sp.]MDY0415168.1 RIP metalloprotease RseP [Pseudomonas sp.]NLO54417.1 RIP metalloprotease RseP [Gammaproteobacteria bacterium]
MSGLYMLLGTLVALGVLVTIHEYGHFWVARRCGVKVLRFSIGFGTPLLRWHDRHGTEFVIAMIPLGGYVKMLDEREAPVAEQEQSQSFNGKTVGQRIAIVAAGPIANFALAFVLFWCLAMLGSQQVKPVVGEVVVGSLAEAAGLLSGQEIVSVDGQHVNGWADVNLQLIRRIGDSGTLQIEAQTAGNSAANTYSLTLDKWLYGAEEPNPIESMGIQPWRPQATAVVAQLDPEGPAQYAGLQLEDKIVAIDGLAVNEWQTVVNYVQARPDSKVQLRIERAGQVSEVNVLLAAQGAESQQRGYLGVGVAGGEWPPEMLREVRFGPIEAISAGAQRTWTMSALTLGSLKKMLFGELSVKNLSGPISIAKVAGASAESGLRSFLNFMAYLSISLGVLNLLPIPVLDGGHLLFYFAELVRGRPLSERVQAYGMQIGIALVVGVMLLAVFNDLARL